MTNKKTFQLYRNGEEFKDRQSALNVFSSDKLANVADGELVVVRYMDGLEHRSILGIKNLKTGFEIFEGDETIDSLIRSYLGNSISSANTVTDSLNSLNKALTDGLEKKADKATTYTKTDVNQLLDKKVNVDDFNSYSDNVNTKLTDTEKVIAGGLGELKNKADAITVYTKTEVNAKLADKLDASAYTPYDDSQLKKDIADVQSTDDNIIKAVGLSSDGSYSKSTDKAIISAATSVKSAIELLNDHAVKDVVKAKSQAISVEYPSSGGTVLDVGIVDCGTY